MLELDGSEGGGQLLRTALALSALTGEAFRMRNVRGSRPEPGLKSQHAAALWAVARVCDAEVEGGARGSETVTFEPGAVGGEDVRVEVGTAGSVPLVFDALLPVAYALSEPLSVTVVGGTDVRWAPTMAHHAEVKRRVVSRFGVRYRDEVARLGFYPVGGGEATLHLSPSSPADATLTDRGAFEGGTVYAYASDDLEQAAVADRMADRVLESHPGLDRRAVYRPADSTGAACCLRATFTDAVAGFDALGEPGRSSEAVAEAVLEAFESFRDGTAAVDAHTADQVMVPLAVCGGAVAVPRVTDHVASNAEVVRAFGGDLHVERREDGTAVLRSAGGLGSA
ncbi:RNA 3'-terminal phosphate cyclase [Salinirubellus salinus]|uniref:RNA 3'-terminal phosphate cyclase n=1 Tax=Salinirubellus salinus TaxID=1364945 RepID=A0A9E7UBR7_9EURY|nr:RNA 3'-terminal phosphate cyclase [Salinirubellus salinus]UWM55488.1 RNA 3'-terminal phosphate cyclase [Salinirubellus salinus]